MHWQCNLNSINDLSAPSFVSDASEMAAAAHPSSEMLKEIRIKSAQTFGREALTYAWFVVTDSENTGG